MKIVVLCPMQREFDYFKKSLEEYINNTKQGCTEYEIIYSITGVGIANMAAQTALSIERYTPDLIVIVGFATGTIRFSKGQLVAPKYTQYSDFDVPEGCAPDLEKTYELEGEDKAWILTGDRFVDEKYLSKNLGLATTAPYLYDMESCAAAQICSKNSQKLLVLKMISDLPQTGEDETAYQEFVDSHSDFTPFVDYIYKHYISK